MRYVNISEREPVVPYPKGVQQPKSSLFLIAAPSRAGRNVSFPFPSGRCVVDCNHIVVPRRLTGELLGLKHGNAIKAEHASLISTVDNLKYFHQSETRERHV